MTEPMFTIYREEGDDLSSDYGAGPKWYADAFSREETKKIMSQARAADNLAAIHAVHENGLHYVLTVDGELIEDEFANTHAKAPGL
ncbi:hypothetical protein [Rhizobium sp. MHM7A]|uniref:hypothetical protein n=1 Tax=Rhizobium sp. MHM7A TaxID=2583233 RepID=UPI00110588F7|nr:hypothetical protein [Rhizobium sp. MHM7A]TLX17241.1 hypothetical protein FFR93_08060 [Rhizobium sp. MHM7A]